MSQDNSNHELETDRLIGTKWEDRYEIIALLGEGATSKVYKARHLLLDSIVAIKILKQGESISESQRRRFLKEANLLKTFEHPNIVRLLAFGQTSEGQDYMVLEYVEGQSLADLLKDRQRLGQTEAIALFKAICSGLAYAHEKGILHRDLKPANIMVTGKGEITSRIARLADFGIFKDIEAGDQKLTQAGEFLGSSNYMSPEQCSNKQLDQRSDLYSLGCLFYETLVGKAPMDDTSDLAIMSNQMNRKITDLPANPHISKGLRELVVRCLEKNPEARPGSAKEVLLELEKAAKESTAGSRVKARVPGATAILLIIAGLSAICIRQGQKHEEPHARENKTYLFQYRGLKLPQFPRTPEGLKQLGYWIEANLNSRNPDFNALVLAMGQEMEIRTKLGLPTRSEYGSLVEKSLIERLASGKHSEIERYKLEEALADAYQLNGKREKSEERLLSLLSRRPVRQQFSEAEESYRISKIYNKLANLHSKQEYLQKALPALESDLSSLRQQGDSVLSLSILIKQTGIYAKTGNAEKAKERLSQASATIEQILTKEKEKVKDLNSKVMLQYLTLSNELSCQKRALDLFNPILGALSKDKNSQAEYLLAQLEAAKALRSCGKVAESDTLLERLIGTLSESNKMDDDMVLSCFEALHIMGRDSAIGPEIESYLSSKEKATGNSYLASLENLLRGTAGYKFDRAVLFKRIEQVLNQPELSDYQRGVLACTTAHKLREFGKAKDSIRLYKKAANLLDRPGADSPTLSVLFAGTALAQLLDGDPESAERSIDRAEHELLHVEDPKTAIIVQSTRALVLRAQHKYAEAITIHKQLADTQAKLGLSGLPGSLFELLRDYAECGRADEFAELLPSYLNTLDELGRKDVRKQLLEITKAACLQEGKRKAADELEKFRSP